MVIGIIIFFAALGLLFAFVAIGGVNKQEALLSQSSSEQVLGDNKKLRLTALKAWIAHEKETKHRGKEVRVGEGYHLLLRLSTIADSISRTDAREIPSLGDLHTLTLQDETSRLSSTALRTITSFMLILGIAGTLLGVHDVLSHPDEQGGFSLAKLPPALMPSMLAVSCTVLLMWLRGYYMAILDRYLEKLDLFTMTEIVPKLQPMSNVGISVESFMVQLKRLGILLQAVEASADSLSKTQESLQELKDVSGALNGEYRHISGKNKEFEDDVASMNVHLQEVSDAMNRVKDDSFAATLKQVRNHCKMIENNSKDFQALLESLSQTSQSLQEGKNAMKDLNVQASRTTMLAASVGMYAKHLDELLSHSELIEKAYQRMNKLKQDMEAAKMGTVDSSQHAREALRATQMEMGNFSSIFEQDIQEGQRSVVYAREQFERALDACVAASKELNNAFKKRADVVNLN